MTESPLHESDAPDAPDVSDEPIALEAEVEAPVTVPEPDETVIEAAAEDIVAEAPAEEAEEMCIRDRSGTMWTASPGRLRSMLTAAPLPRRSCGRSASR